MAFLVPDSTAANVQYAETLAQGTQAGAGTIIIQTLTFTPSSAGDYVWLVNGFTHEGPGGSSAEFYAYDSAAAIQQHTQDSYIPGTEGFIPLTHFERKTLAASSQSFTIRINPDDTTGSHYQGLTQILFRTDVFDAVQVADAAGNTTTTSTTYVNKATLTTSSVASAADHVYLAGMMVDSTASTAALSEYGEVTLAGAQQLEDEAVFFDRASYNHQIAWAYGENTTGSRQIDLNYKTENASRSVESQYAHIISLRYREASMSLGSEQTNSVSITVSVHHTNTTGGDPQLITSASTVVTAATADPLALALGSGLQQTFTSADPRLLRVQIEVTAVSGSGTFTLDYDGTCATSRCSNLNTPVVVVPEGAVALAAVGILIPLVTAGAWRRKRLALRAREANSPFPKARRALAKGRPVPSGPDSASRIDGAHSQPPV